MGESPDLELECYAALASRVDAFIDIFNGKKLRPLGVRAQERPRQESGLHYIGRRLQ
ncbi:unnamed protein product, partial [Pylaiella littoralis]